MKASVVLVIIGLVGTITASVGTYIVTPLLLFDTPSLEDHKELFYVKDLDGSFEHEKIIEGKDVLKLVAYYKETKAADYDRRICKNAELTVHCLGESYNGLEKLRRDIFDYNKRLRLLLTGIISILLLIILGLLEALYFSKAKLADLIRSLFDSLIKEVRNIGKNTQSESAEILSDVKSDS